MTDYYLRTSGSDAAAGTSPAAAWATLDNALDNLSAGDTLYIGPGTHIHDAAVRDAYGGTLGNSIIFQGDPWGENTGDLPGPVVITNQATDFSPGQVTGRLLEWTNDSKFFEWHDVVFANGGTSILEYGISIGSNTGAFALDGVVFEDCMFFDKGDITSYQSPASLLLNFGDGDTPSGSGPRIRRCFFDNTLYILCDDNVTATFDIDVRIESCVWKGGDPQIRINSGNGTYNITGVRIVNCSNLASKGGTAQFIQCDYPVNGVLGISAHGTVAERDDLVSILGGATDSVEINYSENSTSTSGPFAGSGSVQVYGDAAPPNAYFMSQYGAVYGYLANQIWDKYFGFRPFLNWEPLHLWAWKNTSMGKGDPTQVPTLDYYGRPFDTNRESYVFAGFFNGDFATVPWGAQTYSASDPDADWTADTVINETTFNEYASCSTVGTVSDSELTITGAAVNLSAGQVIQDVYFEVNLRLQDVGDTLHMKFYTAGEAEDLGTYTFTDADITDQQWHPKTKLTRPAGGWTTAVMQGLICRMWVNPAACYVYAISLWIDSGNHDAGAVRAQGPRAIETTIVDQRSKSIKLVRGGMYQTTIPCVAGVPITVSASGYMDANYAGNKPSLEVFNIPGGVALQEDAMVGAAESWEYVNVSFTPTANGLATVRLRSQCTSDDGNCYFENLQYA